MTQYRVSDRPQRVGGYESYFKPGDIVEVPDIENVDNEGETFVEGKSGWRHMLPSALDPIEPEPNIGRVIQPDDIQVGDTIRVTYTSQGLDSAFTLTVSEYDDIEQVVKTLQGGAFYLYSGYTIHLVNRPTVDPEVQAIMDALSVDVNTASDYHSRGIRATETPVPTPTA
jgi:hypothetical protein